MRRSHRVRRTYALKHRVVVKIQDVLEQLIRADTDDILAQAYERSYRKLKNTIDTYTLTELHSEISGELRKLKGDHPRRSTSCRKTAHMERLSNEIFERLKSDDPLYNVLKCPACFKLFSSRKEFEQHVDTCTCGDTVESDVNVVPGEEEAEEEAEEEEEEDEEEEEFSEGISMSSVGSSYVPSQSFDDLISPEMLNLRGIKIPCPHSPSSSQSQSQSFCSSIYPSQDTTAWIKRRPSGSSISSSSSCSAMTTTPTGWKSAEMFDESQVGDEGMATPALDHMDETTKCHGKKLDCSRTAKELGITTSLKIATTDQGSPSSKSVVTTASMTSTVVDNIDRESLPSKATSMSMRCEDAREPLGVVDRVRLQMSASAAAIRSPTNAAKKRPKESTGRSTSSKRNACSISRTKSTGWIHRATRRQHPFSRKGGRRRTKLKLRSSGGTSKKKKYVTSTLVKKESAENESASPILHVPDRESPPVRLKKRKKCFFSKPVDRNGSVSAADDGLVQTTMTQLWA